MTRLPSASPTTETDDEDLVIQANPGYGIPSQDPDPLAQTMLDPEDAARETNSVFTAGGVMAGAATGAAIGVAVGGPVGVLVGASVGAVAGAMGGAAVGAAANLGDSSQAENVDLDPLSTPRSGPK